MSNVLRDIYVEMRRQEAKWGEQNHPDEWYLPIMLEEIGETAKAMLEAHFAGAYPGLYPNANAKDIRKELIEATAVGFAWLECIDRRC